MSSGSRSKFGRNRSAVELTILALNNLGRLEDIDAAKVASAQTLADAVDADPTNASLWREYRAAEQSLRESHDTTADEFVTGIVGSSTSPNVTINWSAGELDIAEGTYDLVVVARDGATKDRVFRPGNPPQVQVVESPSIPN